MSGLPTIVCHECERPRGQVVRNCLTDEGRPLETGLQEQVSNRLSTAVAQNYGRERERKRPGIDWVRYQARRGPQGNHC